MKNLHAEQIRRRAKQYARHHPLCANQYGIQSYQLFEQDEVQSLSWWHDFSFVLNDYHVHVAWVHPRTAYREKVRDEARLKVASLWSDEGSFNVVATQYCRRGNSRKAAVLQTVDLSSNDRYYEALFDEEEKLARASDAEVRPFIRTQWTTYGRSVDLCVPMEIHGMPDLGCLARLARRLLKRETSLDHEYPEYVYSRTGWIEEEVAHVPGILPNVRRVW